MENDARWIFFYSKRAYNDTKGLTGRTPKEMLDITYRYKDTSPCKSNPESWNFFQDCVYLGLDDKFYLASDINGLGYSPALDFLEGFEKSDFDTIRGSLGDRAQLLFDKAFLLSPNHLEKNLADS